MVRDSREPQSDGKRRLWTGVACFWVVFGFCYSNQMFLEMQARGHGHTWWRMTLWGVLMWSMWILLTPLILELGRRFPIEKGGLLKALPAHLAGFAFAALVHLIVSLSLSNWLQPFYPMITKETAKPGLLTQFVSSSPFVFFVYSTVLVFGYVLHYRSKYLEQELQASKLESLLSQAQVLSLKMQLQPHFLFNTLNGIVSLVRANENKAAEQMIHGLSSMLRYTLDNSGRQEVTLQEELDFLKLYVGIEQMRFPDRLSFSIDVPDHLLSAQVPSLLLQPLVENSVRHGMAPRAKPGSIRVSAAATGPDLRLTVEDDGLGLKNTTKLNGCGVGLSNTRERLTRLYGEHQELSIESNATGGCTVEVRLPLRGASVAMEPVGV